MAQNEEIEEFAIEMYVELYPMPIDWENGRRQSWEKEDVMVKAEYRSASEKFINMGYRKSTPQKELVGLDSESLRPILRGFAHDIRELKDRFLSNRLEDQAFQAKLEQVIFKYQAIICSKFSAPKARISEEILAKTIFDNEYDMKWEVATDSMKLIYYKSARAILGLLEGKQ